MNWRAMDTVDIQDLFELSLYLRGHQMSRQMGRVVLTAFHPYDIFLYTKRRDNILCVTHVLCEINIG